MPVADNGHFRSAEAVDFGLNVQRPYGRYGADNGAIKIVNGISLRKSQNLLLQLDFSLFIFKVLQMFQTVERP